MQPQQPNIQDEEGPNKAVHIMFLSGGLLLFFLANWTGEWLGSYVVRNPNDFLVNGIAAFIALVVGIALYRNDNVYTLAHEVASELKKVTWPSRGEVQNTTLVVILTSAFFGFYLWGLDLLFTQLMKQIMGSR